ncbi:MAG: hypothetical protein WAN86_12420 [Hyphomicrobiaceae bacterium]
MTKDPNGRFSLAFVARAGVALWIGALALAAFLPLQRGEPPRPPRPPPGGCQISGEGFDEIIRTHKTSDAIAAAIVARCKDKGVNVSADQPAGENWLMRNSDVLNEEVKRPGYRRMRELFIAAELQQDFAARHVALRKILSLAETPLLRHRVQIEIAHTALRSGEAENLTLAAAAAKAAHGEAQFLPKQARADAYLVDAELALRAGELRKSIDLVDRALEHDAAYLAAHLLRLDLVVRISARQDEAVKARYLDWGIASASFVRLLTTKSYVVDARSAIAEHHAQSDVGALLTFYLSSLADDREGARRAIAELLAQCAGARVCSAAVIERARRLMNAL